MTRSGRRSTVKAGIEPRSAAFGGGRLTTRPTRRSPWTDMLIRRFPSLSLRNRSRRSNLLSRPVTVSGHLVPVLTSYCHVSGKAAIRMPLFKSLVWKLMARKQTGADWKERGKLIRKNGKETKTPSKYSFCGWSSVQQGPLVLQPAELLCGMPKSYLLTQTENKHKTQTNNRNNNNKNTND